MVEAAHLRELYDLTHPGRLYSPRLRTVLLEREVRSRPVVVVAVETVKKSTETRSLTWLRRKERHAGEGGL
jgi:hypothetical protein